MSEHVMMDFNRYFTAVRDAIENTPAFRHDHPVAPHGYLHHPAADSYAWIAIMTVAGLQGEVEKDVTIGVAPHVHDCPLTGQEIYDRLRRYMRSKGM